MVEIAVDLLLYPAEIHHHAIGIQLSGTAMYGYHPIMAVQTDTLAFVGQLKAVRTDQAW